MSVEMLRALIDGAPEIGIEPAPEAAGWPDPAPLPDTLPPVAEFDPALLPAALRPWISDIAERMQCPVDFPAVGAMIALSAVVGRQIAIRPKCRDDWTVSRTCGAPLSAGRP